MYKNRLVIIVLFVIISFFIFRHCTVVGASVIETLSSYAIYPVLRVQQLLIEPITLSFKRRTTIQDLEQKIEDLQKERDTIFAENVALKSVHYYADETSELRDFNKKYLLQRGYVAQVLARHFSANNQFFLVNAGSVNGITKDMVALCNNAIVGRVTQVYPWYCKVCLITDVDCKIAALSLQSDVPFGVLAKNKPLSREAKNKIKKGASGIHEGINNELHTVVRYVSHLEQVTVGDDVFSSGEGLVFPKGFALGKVIAADKGELFYTIIVKPALDFQTLSYCTLIAKQDI